MDPNLTLTGVLRGCLDCGVAVINPSGEMTCLTPVAAELLSVQSPLPVPVNLLAAPVFDFVRRALHSPVPLEPVEVRIRCPQGRDQVLALEASCLTVEGNPKWLLLQVRGIPAHHELETRIRHFERLARLGVLSAGLAHELRNSMVALSALADMLLEQQPGNELAQTVRRELDRANTLAVRMLKYARPNPPTRKPVSTHDILERALQLAHPRLNDAGARVTRALRAEPDLISADEAHLEQMFLNLLINAADALQTNGEVTLSTEIVEREGFGRTLRITVTDSGVGIAPEVLPNLFQPFFTTKRHGTGLGLYLARQIVDEHSGCIQIQSLPQQGTCVQIYLPVHQG